MKIYTSYYANPKLKDRSKYLIVQISATKPSWIKVDKGINPFKPHYQIVEGHKKGTVDDKTYTEIYINQLKCVMWNQIFDKFKRYEALGKDIVLCCWCMKGKFCHRTILAAYMNKYFNLNIEEL